VSSDCHLLSRWFLVQLVPPKWRLIFNGLHDVISQKTVNFRLFALQRVSTSSIYSYFPRRYWPSFPPLLLFIIIIIIIIIKSRYSDWLRAGRTRGRSSSPGRVKNFHFSMSSRPALGPTQPPFPWVLGALSPGLKQPRCEAGHSPPTSAEVKKTWVYTSTPPYVFMAQCLISSAQRQRYLGCCYYYYYYFIFSPANASFNFSWN
jgi:hypothetical protein